MDSSLSGSSVHGILQARILEWVAISFSRGFFLIQGSNPCLLCLLHYRHILYLLSHQRSHNLDERAANLFWKWPSLLFDSSLTVKPGKQPRHKQLGLGGCVPKTSIYKIELQAGFGPSLQFVYPWFILRKCYRKKEIVSKLKYTQKLLTLNRFTRTEQLFKCFLREPNIAASEDSSLFPP